MSHWDLVPSSLSETGALHSPGPRLWQERPPSESVAPLMEAKSGREHSTASLCAPPLCSPPDAPIPFFLEGGVRTLVGGVVQQEGRQSSCICETSYLELLIRYFKLEIQWDQLPQLFGILWVSFIGHLLKCLQGRNSASFSEHRSQNWEPLQGRKRMLKGYASLLIGCECPVGNYGSVLTNIELRFHKCDGHGRSCTPTTTAWTLSPVAAFPLTVSSASSLENEAT